MGLYEWIPTEYVDKNKKDEFFLWLRCMPLPLHTKKYVLLDWCKLVGIPMDRDYADALGIPHQI